MSKEKPAKRSEHMPSQYVSPRVAGKLAAFLKESKLKEWTIKHSISCHSERPRHYPQVFYAPFNKPAEGSATEETNEGSSGVLELHKA